MGQSWEPTCSGQGTANLLQSMSATPWAKRKVSTWSCASFLCHCRPQRTVSCVAISASRGNWDVWRCFGWGEGQAVGKTVGRWLREGWNVALVLDPSPDPRQPTTVWVVWIYATKIRGADLSRFIGAATVLLRIRGKVSSCSEAALHQPQICTGSSAGTICSSRSSTCSGLPVLAQF